MKLNRYALAILAGLTMAPMISAALAAEPSVAQPEDLSWGAAPGLPPGAEIAVLYGDPSKPGPFAIRLKFPAGYQVATHSHPTDELITFLSGKSRMAFGEEAGEADASEMQPGAFMVLPAGAWHSLWVDGETIVEMHSTGPFDTHLH